MNTYVVWDELFATVHGNQHIRSEVRVLREEAIRYQRFRALGFSPGGYVYPSDADALDAFMITYQARLVEAP